MINLRSTPDANVHGGKTFPPEVVHVLLCTNADFLQHAAVCLTSLLINNSGLFFEIVVASRATEQLDQGRLRRSLARFPNHELSFREFTPPLDRLLPLNPQAHYTLDNWARLWVQYFFPETIARVLYLDSAIVVVGDVGPLWLADLDGALLGAVDIPGSDRGVTNLGLRMEDGYFNSGVLLIDLKQWRETCALETLLRYVESYPERMVFDVDQEALNACFHHRWKKLDYKWNAIRPFFDEPSQIPLSRLEIDRVRREACVIHFNGNSKPWSYFCEHPRKVDYEAYLSLTEWRGFIPHDRTFVNRIRKLASALLPPAMKAGIKTIIRYFTNSRTGV